MEEAPGAAARSVGPFVTFMVAAHGRRAKHGGMTARARPTSVALAGLTGGGARCTAAATRVAVVPAEPLGKLFLAELLGLVQAYHERLCPNHDAIHLVQSGGSFMAGQ